MLVSISGAQGCGKSSVVRYLLKNGTDVDVADTQVARSVLADLGLTLHEVIEQGETSIINFQNTLLEYKHEFDLSISESNEPVIIERCPIDLAAFASSWDTGTEEYSAWLEEYKLKCYEQTFDMYNEVFFLPVGIFDHIDDGVRATADTQKEVSDYIYMGLIESGVAFHWVEGITVEERSNEILEELKKL